MVQGKINRDRHTDHPAARHSIRTNQCPPPPSPIFYRPDALPADQPTVSKHWRQHTICVVFQKTTVLHLVMLHVYDHAVILTQQFNSHLPCKPRLDSYRLDIPSQTVQDHCILLSRQTEVLIFFKTNLPPRLRRMSLHLVPSAALSA